MRHIRQILSLFSLLCITGSMLAVHKIETPMSKNDFENRYSSGMPSQLKELKYMTKI